MPDHALQRISKTGRAPKLGQPVVFDGKPAILQEMKIINGELIIELRPQDDYINWRLDPHNIIRGARVKPIEINEANGLFIIKAVLA